MMTNGHLSLAFRMTERVLCEVRTEAYVATVDTNVSPFTRQVQETILVKIQPLRSSPPLKNFSALLSYIITLPTNTCCYYGYETWFRPVMEEYKLRMLDSGLLRGIVVRRREARIGNEKTVQWGIFSKFSIPCISRTYLFIYSN
jgi:hypothetical protein